MPVACADCGCLVERGVRVACCPQADCCCAALPSREELDRLAAQIRQALSARDLSALGELLADDVRWGDEQAANRCRNRREVLETFGRLLSAGVTGEVTEVETGPAGVLCRLSIHWPEPAEGRRAEVFHLYRVQAGRIAEIVPFGDRPSGRAALSALQS